MCYVGGQGEGNDVWTSSADNNRPWTLHGADDVARHSKQITESDRRRRRRSDLRGATGPRDADAADAAAAQLIPSTTIKATTNDDALTNCREEPTEIPCTRSGMRDISPPPHIHTPVPTERNHRRHLPPLPVKCTGTFTPSPSVSLPSSTTLLLEDIAITF